MKIANLLVKLNNNVVITIIVLFFVVYLVSIPVSYTYAQKQGPKKISKTANKITVGLESDEEKVIALMEWIQPRMESSYFKVFIPRYPFFPFIFRPNDPNWTILTMYGACEEYAKLFVAMAKSIGIPARTVHNTGEDHTWAEVYIDGKWIHADPSNGRYNDPGFYERVNDGWGKDISSVWYEDSEGAQHSLTSKYTDVSKVTIQVVRDNTPQENADIIIKSWFLKDNYATYRNLPLRRSISGKTDSNGEATFELGKGKYTVIAEKSIFKNIFGYRNEINFIVEEGKEYEQNIYLTRISLLENPRVVFNYLKLPIAIWSLVVIEFLVIMRIKRQKENYAI